MKRMRESRSVVRRSAPAGLAVAVSAVSMLCLPSASAEPEARLGASGQFAVSAEDLTGFFAIERKFDNAQNVELTDRLYQWSLFLQRGGVRLGAHYFVLPSLSVGAILGYESRTGEMARPQGGGRQTVSTDKGTEWMLAFSPRVGFAFMVSDLVGFWFRGGPGYLHTTSYPIPLSFAQEHEYRETYWLLGMDALLAVVPVPHFGILAGPTADFTLSGSYGETDPTQQPPVDFDHDGSYRRLAITVGLVGAF